MLMIYKSTKTYGHETGLSCAFRQWKADSHCNILHGYALAVHLEFEAVHLDDRNWVIDFGGLKDFKQKLADTFDHKTLVAKDDPELAWFEEAHRRKIADVVFVDRIGCEAFAELIHGMLIVWLSDHQLDQRVRITKVMVSEHAGNSASVT